MATAFTLVAEGGGMFPQSSLVNKFATRKGIAFCSLTGSSGTTYTITSTDKTALGLASIDGVNLIGTEATTGSPTALVTIGYTPSTGVITLSGVPTYKPSTLAVVGKPIEPTQNV
jgi:hypothetical protein